MCKEFVPLRLSRALGPSLPSLSTNGLWSTQDLLVPVRPKTVGRWQSQVRRRLIQIRCLFRVRLCAQGLQVHIVTRKFIPGALVAIELDRFRATQCFARPRLHRLVHVRPIFRLKLLSEPASRQGRKSPRCVHVGYLETRVSYGCHVSPTHIHDAVSG